MAGILDVFDKVTVLEPFAQTLEGAEVLDFFVDVKNKYIRVDLKSKTLISSAELFEFSDNVKNIYGLDDIDIRVKYVWEGSGSFEFSDQYYRNLLYTLFRKNGICKAFLMASYSQLTDNVLKIKNVKSGREILEKNNCAASLEKIISFELDRPIEVCIDIEEIDIEAYKNDKKEREEEINKKASAPIKREIPKEEVAGEVIEVPGAGTVYGKPITEDIVSMSELRAGMGICVVRGEVLDADIREIKKDGKLMYIAVNFDMGDDNWGISCELFGKANDIKKVVPVIKEGNILSVRGNYDYDERARGEKMKVLSIELHEKQSIRMDNAKEKRVELHLHTKMSAKDAITSPSDLINRAAKWGHSAIAITDHGVAQAFPEAFGTLKKIRKGGQDFKIIYGTEGYFVNDLPLGVDSVPKSYKDSIYIVFDIETTGLSPETETITEIGGVKIMDGEIVNTFSKLINPGREISPQITQLTGITNEMVKDAPTIDEVLPEFIDFCGKRNHVKNFVVAHNARFDVGFIKAEIERYNQKLAEGAEKLSFDEYPIIDTLELSRELFPNEKSHKLDLVCERLGVSLENHHRALDDATATAEAFIKLHTIKEQSQSALDDSWTIDKNEEFLKNPYQHIILLAKNEIGLKNMYTLISKSNLKYFYKRPRIPKSVLSKYREGLIIGSACEAGELYMAIRQGRPWEEVEKIAAFYDYLEIQPLGNNEFMVRGGEVESREALKDFNRKICELGEKLGKPVVATCDVHFMDPKDELYRRVLQGAQGYGDADMQAPLYLRTTDEMLEEFSYLGKEKAYEVVVTNTNFIANMIEDIEPLKGGTYNPSIENCEQDLENMCHEKAHREYGEVLPPIVQERMDRELGCILKYGYAVMYMIAHKLVKKSNEAGYLVGSRGSVGSSFAAYLAGITEVNALAPHYICPDCKESEFFTKGEYNIGIDMPDKNCPKCGAKMRKDGFNIPFETFLGFKGDKVPDIDLNFSGEYQATAHKYVGELFGDAFVFKAGTIGTIADKTAIGFYGRKYYENKGIIPTQAELKRVSKGLVDIKNTTGQHPGGIIVCPKTMDIHEFCPVQHPAEKKDSGIITTHFDFHSIHDNLLKLDILGHDDPSTIRMLETLTGIDATKIPLDDPETMSIFSSTDALKVTPEQIHSKVGTFGVPEFGTSFTRQMLLDTLPTTFYELVLIAGLSHGTDVWLGNAQELIRAGTATLSEVIGVRDDIMTYLMNKGVEPGLAFKIMEFVRKGRAAKEGMPEEYETPMRENNVPDWYIESCKKIKYMFPKAHAAAYVMMAFRVAYFKVHYPIDFYIAYFTVRADLFDAAIMAQGDEFLMNEMRRLEQKQNDWSATEKSVYTICEICHEMYQRGIEFLPADLYESDAFKFQKVDGKIRLPINAFQGVGDAAAQNIMDARADGEFMSVDDLKTRAKLTKTVIETLRENGCLKGLPETSQLSLFDF
ncbi:MAG: PolC-type DNA polymerase III [Clostridia bacterium]|nr:PolC-type DNA polymerase III [Clostridia bacterium]MBR6524147.1 PolC-type DNA polymerase III [Clostridia bacterium]